MSDEEAYQVIEACGLQMGANYLIADNVVYCVTVWVQGGIAHRRKFCPGDYGYLSFYRAATRDPHTLYKEGKRG